MHSSARPVARERSPALAATLSAELAPVASKEEATKKTSSNIENVVVDNDDKKQTTPPGEDPAAVDARVRALYYVMQSVEVSDLRRVEKGEDGGAYKAWNCVRLGFVQSHQQLFCRPNRRGKENSTSTFDLDLSLSLSKTKPDQKNSPASAAERESKGFMAPSPARAPPECFPL